MSLFGGAVEGAPYDTVVCTDDEGERHLTRSEFENLSLLDRVRLLAGGEIRFFMGTREIEKRVALARR